MGKANQWNRDQLLMALRLYMRLPFGRLHSRNPEIISLAERIGRTPGALAMKAVNFANLDPALQARGVRGLRNVSTMDRQIWQEFSDNSEALAAEAEEAAERLANASSETISDGLQAPDGATEVVRSIRTRRVQSFFRAAVATSYGGRCAISGICDPNLLIASHIIPWAAPVERRADPRNGILLNALFDRAFDRGLFTLDDDLRVVVSPKLGPATAGAELACGLDQLAGRAIMVPERFPPDEEALRYHRNNVLVR